MNTGYFKEQAFLEAKNRAYDVAKGIVNPILQEVILIQPLADNKQEIILPLTSEQKGTLYTEEKRLDKSDYFIPFEWGMFIGQDATADALPLSNDVYTYPNAAGLTTATATGTAQVWSKGTFNWKIGTTDAFGEYPLRKFFRVPALQKGTTLTAYVNASSADATTTLAFDGQNWDDTMHSFFPSNIEINANKNNQFSINLPSGLTLDPGSSNTNYIIFRFYGYNLPGVDIPANVNP